MKPRTGTENGTESRRIVRRWLVHIPEHSLHIDERVFMVLKYTETGKVLKNNQKVLKAVSEHERQLPTFLFKLPYWTYLLSMSIFFWFWNCLWKLLIVSRTLAVSVYFKTINTCSSEEKCGLKCVPSSYSFSAFYSICLFHFLVSLIVKH